MTKASLLHRIYYRLVQMNDSPSRIAGGVAIGVLTGVAPTFGLGGIAAVGLAALLRCNIAAALLGAATGAPPFIFGMWFASAYIGSVLLGMKAGRIYEMIREGEIMQAGWNVLLAYALGNVIITAVLSALSFFAVLYFLKRRARRGTKSS
jgi:uncharacterized protein (DUF2062 family)